MYLFVTTGSVQWKLNDCHEGQELRGDRNRHASVHPAHDSRLQLPESLQGQSEMPDGYLWPSDRLPNFVSHTQHAFLETLN